MRVIEGSALALADRFEMAWLDAEDVAQRGGVSLARTCGEVQAVETEAQRQP
ncbi:hypothetical protein [Allokutzneria oryzae]|uniref:Uncharacterized protein n=1 Tax=Allokutzneria oryzae TaxID=1378989 RepID=A0ABV6A3Y1_9PSEU